MSLEQELQTFEKELPQLVQHEENQGKFALVHGDRVEAICATVDEALDAGYARFGLDPFLVMEITGHEQPRYFSRKTFQQVS